MAISGSAASIVNTTTTTYQFDPAVAALHGGGWVVTWSSLNQDGDSWGVYQQRYDAAGEKVDGEQLVNTLTEEQQYEASVASLSDGGWLVSWTDSSNGSIYQQRYAADGQTDGSASVVRASGSRSVLTGLVDGGWVVTWQGADGNGSGVYHQRFDEDGATVGSATLVNTNTSGSQMDPEITDLANGGWITTWSTLSSAGPSIQRFDSNGGKVGSEVVLSTSGSYPTICGLTDGGYVAAWYTPVSGFAAELQVQRFDASGVSQNVSFVVTNDRAANQYKPTLAALNDGGWVMTWVSHGSQGLNLYQQVFDSSGKKIGAETQLNTAPIHDQEADPRVAALEDGGWVVTWQARADADSAPDIFQRVFHTTNDAPTAQNRTVTVDEETTLSFSVSSFGFLDSNSDNLATVVITQLPTKGVFSLSGDAVVNGQTISRSDLANLTWTPPKDEFGTNYASFAFRVTDDGGSDHGGMDSSAEYTFSLNVRDVIDRFAGSTKADVLVGTAGRDIIDGGKAKDILTGGKGADTFIFERGDGKDKITDFAAFGRDHDVLDLSSVSDIKNFKDLMQNHLEKASGGLIIHFGKADEIFLQHVEVGNLDKSDFDF